MKKIVTATAIAVFISGCAGTMNGMVRDTGERVQMSYTQGMQHDSLEVVMPDGETFTGKVVMTGNSTSMGWGYGSATATNSYGGSAYATGSAFSVVDTYTGSMLGVLFGDRNHTMRCKLQYADSSGFTTMGGVGLCETSDGRVIDVQW